MEIGPNRCAVRLLHTKLFITILALLIVTTAVLLK
jgi:hypothetical protein